MNEFCMHKHISLCPKVNSIIVVISPLLAMYGIGVSTVTLLDFTILLVLCLNLFAGKNPFINGMQKRIGLIMGMIIINLIIVMYESCTMGNPDLSIAMRTFRFLWYLFFTMFCLSDDCFDADFALRVYEFFAVFSAIYLIIQFILLYSFGFSLKGYLSFLPIMREELQTYSSNLYASMYARPRSIFAEPSQFGIYATGYLGISLFNGIKPKKNFEVLLIILAMLISASSTAIMGILILTARYIIKTIKDKPIEVLLITVVTTAGLITVLFGFESIGNRLHLIFERLPTSFANRIEGFLEYADRMQSFNPIETILGIGMNTEGMTVWYSGTAKILLYWGLIGAICFSFILIKFLFLLKDTQKETFVMFIILSLFSEVLVSNWLILFLPFVLRNLNSNKTIKQSNCTFSKIDFEY